MELYVVDRLLTIVGVVDTIDSLIWTERYDKCGDFEIYTPMSSHAMNLLREGYYLRMKESDRWMIIEGIRITTSLDTGSMLIVTGRSLESILDRRIVWEQTLLTGNLETEVHRLLLENIINPLDTDRKVDTLGFQPSTDQRVTDLTITNLQLRGENLYDVIVSICSVYGLGFNITWSDPDLGGSGAWLFGLYYGTDRSYGQSVNSRVIFSPRYDNLLRSDFFKSDRFFKTNTLVAGEGEGFTRKTKPVAVPALLATGLSRTELFTDASDISSNVEGGTMLEAEYLELLEERGLQSLAEYQNIRTFEAEVDPTGMFIYGRDFFMGDIVQLENEFGHMGRTIVYELIRSESRSGVFVYPTFKAIE